MRVPLIRNDLIELNFMISDLIDVPNRNWNLEKVRSLFYERYLEIILAK